MVGVFLAFLTACLREVTPTSSFLSGPDGLRLYSIVAHSDHFLWSIGSVEEANSIVTADIEPTLSLLTFHNGHISLRVIAVMPRSLTGGAANFLPKFSSDSIAYIDGRGLMLFDIPKHKHRFFTLSNSFSASIKRTVAIDTPGADFVIQIRHARLKGSREFLKVFAFEKDSLITRSSFDAGSSSVAYTPPWDYSSGTIHLFRPESTMVISRDLDFRIVDHPLSKAFNLNRNLFRRLTTLLVHPDHPFALVHETGRPLPKGVIDSVSNLNDMTVLELNRFFAEASDNRRALWLLSWQQDPSGSRILGILTDTTSIFNTFKSSRLSNLEFSPDGKWLLVMDEKGQNKSYWDRSHRYFAFAVDTVWPYLSSEPVHLQYPPGQYAITSTAWVSNPTGFVAAAGDRLYKWDLEGLHERLVEEYRTAEAERSERSSSSVR